MKRLFTIKIAVMMKLIATKFVRWEVPELTLLQDSRVYRLREHLNCGGKLNREDKNWIYFVESVTSVGPMDPKRILEIESMTEKVTAGKIYVTAFLDFVTFKKFSEQLAWETEVWIADMPDHMIHLNGDKFLGPR